MRPGHLRPRTAKAAAQASAQLSTRLSPGEKHGRKWMTEIVAVYDLDPAPRTIDGTASRSTRSALRPMPGAPPSPSSSTSSTLLEYLWKGAWTFFYHGAPTPRHWVADHARTILADRAVDAAATIAHQASAPGFRGSERAGTDQAVAYLTREVPCLDYATTLANGRQIPPDHRGSGTLSDQGPDGPHRHEMDHPRRPSRPAPSRRHRQRR